MKINLLNDKIVNNNQKRDVSFKGFKAVKSEDGFKEYQFAYPYDSNKDDLYLEIYKLDKDSYNNYVTTGQASNRFDHSYKMKLKPGANNIDLAAAFGIDDNTPFAYHYILRNKDGRNPRTRIDAGDSIDERAGQFYESDREKNIYNLVIPSKSDLSKGGAMKLVIIDSQKVGYTYKAYRDIVFDEKLAKRGQAGIKTLTNKFGGTLAGLEHAIDNGEYDNYSRIISLPIFTDDDFTAHSYWNKNCFQMASSLGNINNYASLQKKMFAHGLNFVSDGAFVNEGLQGVHFKHLLKWGVESPYFKWFRAEGLKDNPLSMGVFAKNKKYISHRVVNAPYNYYQDSTDKITASKNSLYDPKKPTYIQFFDRRLVSESEVKDTKNLIKTYSKMSIDNVYKLHTHNDSIFPYAFEIRPEIYDMNIKRLNKQMSKTGQRIYLDSYEAARILSKFENFDVEGKFESGFETWDANPDIGKLNFVYSNADTKVLKNIDSLVERKREMQKIERANYQVQDYAIESGKYWTQKTDDILRLHIAQNLKRLEIDNPSKVYSQILEKSNGKVFPKSLSTVVSKNEVENVLFEMYNNKRVLSNEDKKSQILEGLMNTPLDSFEFGDNIVSVLSSPLISKRATTLSDVGVSRYELFKSGNKNLQPEYKDTYEFMDKLYKNEIYHKADEVLNRLNEKLPAESKLFDGDNVTEYGKYVLPLLTQDIAKYLIVKALAPELTIAVNKNTGELSYDYENLKGVTLEGVGVKNPTTPEEEALMLLKSMRKGLKKVDTSEYSEIYEGLYNKLKNTNVYSFKLADLIIDKTQSGLDWRIDATKDIADVEALRNGNTNFEYTWQSVIDFWSKFNQGVLSKNPNAYTVAEVTDEKSLHDLGVGRYSGKFPKHSDIVSKFLRETGLTSTANYSYFFTDVAKMFTKSFEDGSFYGDNNYKQTLLYDKMIGGNDPYFKSGSLDSLLYSYTFIGNHDKPRALHCAALDMSLFNSDLTDESSANYKNRLDAYRMINNNFMDEVSYYDVVNFDYSNASAKAIAMGYALRKAFVDVLNKYHSDPNNDFSDRDFHKAFIAISQAVSDLSQGKFMGKHFDPEAFGIKPFDVSINMVLKQARTRYDLQIPYNLNSEFENDVFKQALDPAISKLLGMMKYLVALPGMPTLFDGDDVGATGYDSKTKNMYLQGRQRVHDEWLDVGGDKYKEFIAKHKKEFDDVMAVRRNPKCNALNNGAPFMLPLQTSESGVKCPVIFRQSTDGKMAISLFNTSGLHNNSEEYYRPERQVFESIGLNFEVDNDGKFDWKDGGLGVGIAGLNNNTMFVNANDPNDKYYVNEFDGKYFLKRASGDGKIVVDDSTLILYHVPENSKLSFTGRNNFKPVTNFVTNSYKQELPENGKLLALYK